MLCWISKGIINVTRDNFIGVTKNQSDSYYFINLIESANSIVKLNYTPLELEDYESDFKIIKECFLNTFNNSSVRLFNPPTGTHITGTSSDPSRVTLGRAETDAQIRDMQRAIAMRVIEEQRDNHQREYLGSLALNIPTGMSIATSDDSSS